MSFSSKKLFIVFWTGVFLLVYLVWLIWNLQPVNFSGGSGDSFIVEPGEGAREIIARLHDEGYVRSPFAFSMILFFNRSLDDLKSGVYFLESSMTSFEIMRALVEGPNKEITITIPEGFSVYEIDELLSRKGILKSGSLISYHEEHPVEGMLFPDTYRLHGGSEVTEVVDKFLANFNEKASPLLKNAPTTTIILASLLEKEVPLFQDRRLVAGIILKRLKAGMPLQIDATICYIKRQISPDTFEGCYPLEKLDFSLESPYNTYLYRGWPRGPIGNPGLLAIQAALAPQSSSHWFYLSDPATKKTIFSETLEEHNRNRARYLHIR